MSGPTGGRHNRERRRRGLDRSPEQVGEWRRLRVEDERDTRDARRHLLERLQPLGPDRELETGEAGEIDRRDAPGSTLGPPPTGSVTCVNTIGTACRCSCRAAMTGVLLARIRSGAMPTSSIALVRNTSGFSRPAVFDLRLCPLIHPSFAQSIFEGCRARQSFRVVGGKAHQHANSPHSLGLLRARGQRPRCGSAAKKARLTHGVLIDRIAFSPRSARTASQDIERPGISQRV